MSQGDPTPRSLDEFGCWLNCWGWEPMNDDGRANHSRDYLDGYHDAMRHAYSEFDRIYPGWMEAWETYTSTARKAEDRREKRAAAAA